MKIDVSNAKKKRVNELHEFLWVFFTYIQRDTNAPISSQEIWDMLAVNAKRHYVIAVRDGKEFPLIKKMSVKSFLWENSRKRKMRIKKKTFNNIISMIRKKSGRFSKEFYS